MTVGELKSRLDDFDDSLVVAVDWRSDSADIDTIKEMRVSRDDDGNYEDDSDGTMRVLRISCCELD